MVYSSGYFIVLSINFDLSLNSCPSVRVTFAFGLEIIDVNRKFVFLIASQIRVAHEVQRVVVMARAWRNKVQFHLGLLLQR